MNERILRKFVRAILNEMALPKNEWTAIVPGSADFEEVRGHLYNLVNTAYDGVDGGHIKITGKGPESLDRYRYWVVIDNDEDPDIDVAIFGKPEFGAKSAGVGHDGSGAARSAYKEKSAALRRGESVGGIGNWWGEVSGTAAYATLSRGAPAIEDKAKVAQLLAGDKYVWHGAHPDPSAPELFKRYNGWYEKDFGSGGKHIKIITGIPSA